MWCRPVIHDAATETESAVQSRIGKVGTGITLQRQQQAFIVSVELFLDSFAFGRASRGQCTLQLRRQVAETKNRELDRREHFEVLAVLYQLFETTSTGEILFNCFAQRLKADAFQQHPNFERAETARQLRPVIPKGKSFVRFLSDDPGIFRFVGEGGASCLWIAI